MSQIHPQNCPFPFDIHHPQLIHPSFDHPHSPSQTASGFTQPFCDSTLSGQTDRHTHRLTDGIGDRSVPIALIIYSGLELPGGGFLPPSSCLQMLIFEWKSVYNFNPWQNFKHFDIWPPSSFRSIPTLNILIVSDVLITCKQCQISTVKSGSVSSRPISVGVVK